MKAADSYFCVMSLAYNDAAERLLSAQGFDCEPEPKWVVQGKVPDFFCTGKEELWVEVKGLSQPASLDHLSMRFKWLKERSSKVPFSARAHAFISEEASQRDIKEVLRLANRALENQGAARYNQLSVIVPKYPQYGRFVKITIRNEDSAEALYCVRSSNGKHGRPFFLDKLQWRQLVTVADDWGEIFEVQARDLGLLDDDFRLALALEPTQERFYIFGAALRGPARRIGDIHTIRRQARDANRKFKNASEYSRSVPCLLMIFDDTFVGDEQSFLGAFYGNLQAVWQSSGGEDHVSFRYGPNGFWNGTKNQTTSAACYIRKGALPIIAHNYWATNPLPTGLLEAVEYVPQADGTFMMA